MFYQLACLTLLSYLASAIAQISTTIGSQDNETFDASTGCTLSDCLEKYEYDEPRPIDVYSQSSSPTVKCTDKYTLISIITRVPESSQTLGACATLKDDAEYSDYEYKCASGDTCVSSIGWWGCCAQGNNKITSYDCPMITACVEHKHLSGCGKSCSENSYVTRCTDPEKPYCVTATAVQNLADLLFEVKSFPIQTESTGESWRPFDATCWVAQTTVEIVEPFTITVGTQSESPMGLHIACGATPYNGLRFTISASTSATTPTEVNAAARPNGVNPAVLMHPVDFSGTAPSTIAKNPVTFTSCGLEQDCASSTQAAEAGANGFDIGISTPVDQSDDSSADTLRSSLSAGSGQDASNATSHIFPDLFAGIVARATDNSTHASDSGGSTLSFPTVTQSVSNSPTTTSGARKIVALQPRIFLSVVFGLMWIMILF